MKRQRHAKQKKVRSRLSRLARSKSDYTRMRTAINPSTPSQTLLRLTRDSNKYVQLALLQNPNVPISALKLLTVSNDEYIKFRASNLLISLYASGKIALSEHELAQLIQLASIYKTVQNLGIIEMFEDIQMEREYSGMCFYTSEQWQQIYKEMDERQ